MRLVNKLCECMMAAITVVIAIHLPSRSTAEDGGPAERHPNRTSDVNRTKRPPALLYFIYSQAPDHMVLPARRNGEIERVSFANSLKNAKNSDERLELYSKHFAQCEFASRSHGEESVASNGDAENADDSAAETLNDGSPQISKTLFDNKMDKFLPSNGLSAVSPVRELTDALGVDPASTRFFKMSSADLAHTIQKLCLQNELKFQCAYGFLNDVNKIREHIRFMKLNDGNFKVMLEKECKNAEHVALRTANGDLSYFDASKSVYSCIHSNAATILGQCREAIKFYNETRRDVNARMEQIFDETIDTIEKHADAAIKDNDSATLKQILQKGERLIERTLVELSRMEAHKCRRYAMAERCTLEAVAADCSADAADSLMTLLRAGYLQRERGYALHQQFVEARVPAHHACRRFFGDDVVAEAAADRDNNNNNNEHYHNQEDGGPFGSIVDVSLPSDK